ncbi:MAG: hypothetical protein ACXABE_15890, partial [Candidatus Thorarchaeota archaeon]
SCAIGSRTRFTFALFPLSESSDVTLSLGFSLSIMELFGPSSSTGVFNADSSASEFGVLTSENSGRIGGDASDVVSEAMF